MRYYITKYTNYYEVRHLEYVSNFVGLWFFNDEKKVIDGVFKSLKAARKCKLKLDLIQGIDIE